ncbi:hypothetical protein ACMD2_08029 [Ananas comosus]|uniref:Uncharacterized protein n=1 Tax=Ananas comosus TaxID=4615 RepID=A0A199W7X1_ANACO|nr:hypothetical protein ACMD2_08029 [Ananas comosus]
MKSGVCVARDCCRLDVATNLDFCGDHVACTCDRSPWDVEIAYGVNSDFAPDNRDRIEQVKSKYTIIAPRWKQIRTKSMIEN